MKNFHSVGHFRTMPVTQLLMSFMSKAEIEIQGPLVKTDSSKVLRNQRKKVGITLQQVCSERATYFLRTCYQRTQNKSESKVQVFATDTPISSKGFQKCFLVTITLLAELFFCKRQVHWKWLCVYLMYGNII